MLIIQSMCDCPGKGFLLITMTRLNDTTKHKPYAKNKRGGGPLKTQNSPPQHVLISGDFFIRLICHLDDDYLGFVLYRIDLLTP